MCSSQKSCIQKHCLQQPRAPTLVPGCLQVYERTVHRIHQALTNNIRFLQGGSDDLCVSVAGDGYVKVFDLDLGESSAQVLFSHGLRAGNFVVLQS